MPHGQWAHYTPENPMVTNNPLAVPTASLGIISIGRAIVIIVRALSKILIIITNAHPMERVMCLAHSGIKANMREGIQRKDLRKPDL